MKYIYSFLMVCYRTLVTIAAIAGNEKAKLWIAGRKNIWEKLKELLRTDERRIWIHAASLGEFEQGRPIIEKIKADYPQYKIFLTFFSPSGYEVRKNYPGADYIFYLPADSPMNALRFVDLVNPEKVFFIKYEFWFNYLSVLNSRQIPIFLCSAIFRPNQLFFKSYGGWYRQMLHFFTHLFVQDEDSKYLLETIGVKNVTVTGDTRFDRVYAIATQAREIDEVKAFVQDAPCIVAGSSWAPDEDLLVRYLNETDHLVKFIFAPHEIDKEHIERLETSINKRCVRFSEWKQNTAGTFDVLIIDNIGMLSSLYRYGQIAYIGGGFGKGIHNILEAATFGLPVIFGPNYTKFREAVELLNNGGAWSISEYEELKKQLDEFLTNDHSLKTAGQTAGNYVRNHIGATDKILAKIIF
jgi:3-deoxy-D-manno-octulosonic-acid transferase